MILSNEELDKARVVEAGRLTQLNCYIDHDAFAFSEYRRLVRTNWQPTPAVDPLVLEARKLCAEDVKLTTPCLAPGYLKGDFDHGPKMLHALTALKRGMEIAREDKSAERRGIERLRAAVVS